MGKIKEYLPEIATLGLIEAAATFAIIRNPDHIQPTLKNLALLYWYVSFYCGPVGVIVANGAKNFFFPKEKTQNTTKTE